MLGLLSARGQERRLRTQLPFDEATEQVQQPVPIGRRQLLPPTAR
jgi:hypothetical protein